MADSGNKVARVHSVGKKLAPEGHQGNGENESTKAATKSTKIPLSSSAKLSRSHDNLASMLRKKAIQMSTAVAKKTRKKERPATAHGERPAASPATPKARTSVKSLSSMHKSSSIQGFDKGKNDDRFSSRTQSVQNICRIPLPIGTKGSKTPLVPKRSSSAQNMINSGQRSTRLPQSSAVVYNAVLLSNFEKEKKCLENRISELIQVMETRKAEVEKLKYEMKNKTRDTSNLIQSLRAENQQLKEQLHEHGFTTAHFTDNDKILLLEQVSSEHRNSMDFSYDGSFQGASEDAESINLRRSSTVGNLSTLTAHNTSFNSVDFSSLDRVNSLSVDRGLSEIGLAYLRDRILEMQETHYSTNEELQATLQELADLQDAVNELTAENEKLTDEKSIVLESLCTQTEKLENARMQIEHLKALLMQDSDNKDRSENERQLVALIKSAEEEREELLLKQAEFDNALTAFHNENRELQDIISVLRDRAELEESKSKVFQNDKRSLESEICEMKQQKITDQLELTKYKMLLESERQKAGADGKLEDLLAQERKKKKVPTATLR